MAFAVDWVPSLVVLASSASFGQAAFLQSWLDHLDLVTSEHEPCLEEHCLLASQVLLDQESFVLVQELDQAHQEDDLACHHWDHLPVAAEPSPSSVCDR